MVEKSLIDKAYADYKNAGHGDKIRVKKEWSDRFKVTVMTLERWFKQYVTDELENKDANDVRTGQGMEAYVAAIFTKKAVFEDEQARSLATADAVSMCERDGEIPQGAISASTANRIARDLGITNKRKIRRMENRYVNEQQFTDGSGSEHLYFIKRLPDGDCLLGIRNTREKSQKNRRIKSDGTAPDEGRQLVYYYGLSEGCSRVLYAEVVVAAGENAEHHIEFLERAWRIKPDHPLAGIPRKLLTDNGPLYRSQEADSVMRELGVDMSSHKPYQSRAKGKIERPWRTMWQRFELLFLENKSRTIKLSELQSMLTNYLHKYNAQRCPNRLYAPLHITRVEALRRFVKDEIVLPPSDMHLLDIAMRCDSRVVDMSGCVVLDNVYYYAKALPDILLGERVPVRRSLTGNVQVKNTRTNEWIDAEPYRYLEDGEYRGFKHNINDELSAAAAEAEPAGTFLHELPAATCGADGDTVVNLAGAREAQLASQRETHGFRDVTAAKVFMADIIGRPVWKLAEEFPTHGAGFIKKIEMFLEMNLQDRAAIQRFAEQLFQQLPSAASL